MYQVDLLVDLLIDEDSVSIHLEANPSVLEYRHLEKLSEDWENEVLSFSGV